MHKPASTLLVSLLLCTTPAIAGSGHEHGSGGSHMTGPVASDAIILRAGKQVQNLIERGKIDKTWNDAKMVAVEQKDFGKGPEWVVSFNNAKESDAAKKTLYVFYTRNGTYIASNFTGK